MKNFLAIYTRLWYTDCNHKEVCQKMEKYVCSICGYTYDPAQGDPDNGVAPGTKWEDVPADWVCPVCGVGKDQFEQE